MKLIAQFMIPLVLSLPTPSFAGCPDIAEFSIKKNLGQVIAKMKMSEFYAGTFTKPGASVVVIHAPRDAAFLGQIEFARYIFEQSGITYTQKEDRKSPMNYVL
jgi:hypothetical protein